MITCPQCRNLIRLGPTYGILPRRGARLGGWFTQPFCIRPKPGDKGFIGAQSTVISPHVQLIIQNAVSCERHEKRKRFFQPIRIVVQSWAGYSSNNFTDGLDWMPIHRPMMQQLFWNVHPGRSEKDLQCSILNQLARNHSMTYRSWRPQRAYPYRFPTAQHRGALRAWVASFSY